MRFAWSRARSLPLGCDAASARYCEEACRRGNLRPQPPPVIARRLADVAISGRCLRPSLRGGLPNWQSQAAASARHCEEACRRGNLRPQPAPVIAKRVADVAISGRCLRPSLRRGLPTWQSQAAASARHCEEACRRGNLRPQPPPVIARRLADVAISILRVTQIPLGDLRLQDYNFSVVTPLSPPSNNTSALRWANNPLVTTPAI
jgi:hypothetical protein